ncbi:hypothetical protein GQ42DRAFT_158499 [Ramicandelaber brevisporus]|nr:hypothetical protein GQ42DRAFT_158499 [Ramicandelaber brevisporus]
MHTSTDTATETIPMHIRALLGGNVEVLRLAPGGVLLIEYAQPKNQSKKDALDIVGKEFARLCTTVFSRCYTLIVHSDSTSLRPTVGLKNGPHALVTCGDMQLKLELYSYFVCTAYLRPYLYVTTNDCPATLSQLKPRWQKIVREQMFAGKVASDIIRDNEVLAVYSIHNAQDNEADCFSVVINHSLRKIIVAFRGSLTATDWISNMKMGKAFFPIGPPSHEANNSNSNNSSNSTFFNSIKRQEELPQVHGGFLRGYVAGAAQ